MNSTIASMYHETILLKKHARLVRISNTISLFQRKLWNVLLFNAYRELGKKGTFKVTLADIRKEMSWEGKNHRLLPDALEGLCQTAVRWGYFEDDGDFGVTTLLAGAEYHEGVITYSFAPLLIPFLTDPKLFGMINLRLSCRLKSKYSLSLYENAVVFIDPQRKSGRSQFISVPDLYDLLGASPEKSMRDFKRDCLELAIDEINTKTNITLDVEYNRSGRGRSGGIHAVQLIVTLKPQHELDLDNLVEIQINQELVQRMQQIGVTPTVAMQLANQFDEDFLEMNLRKLDTVATFNKSKAAYFVSAVKKGYLRDEMASQNALPSPTADKTRKKLPSALQDDPPEIIWFKGLIPEHRAMVTTAFRDTLLAGNRPASEIDRLDEQGPLSPHSAVSFHLFLKKHKTALIKKHKL